MKFQNAPALANPIGAVIGVFCAVVGLLAGLTFAFAGSVGWASITSRFSGLQLGLAGASMGILCAVLCTVVPIVYLRRTPSTRRPI